MTEIRLLDEIRSRIAQIEPNRAARVLALAIGTVAVLGLLSEFVLPRPSRPAQLLDLDAEYSVPAAVSGLLLLAAGLTGLISVWPSWPWRLLSVGLVYAALDEVLSIHERLEYATGIDWMKLYAPAFVLAVIAGSLAVRHLRHVLPTAVPLLGAGLAAWSTAQVLEVFEWLGTDVEQAGYVPMMITEEILEDVGSACFLIAMLVIARSREPGDRVLTRVTSTG